MEVSAVTGDVYKRQEYTETGYSDGIFDDRNMPERAGAESKKDDTDKEGQTQKDSQYGCLLYTSRCV